MSDPVMIKLYEDSVKEFDTINEQLAPLIEKENELQAKFAPIRQELKAVCAEISKIKKDTGWATLYNRVNKMKPKYDRGEL